MRIIIVGTAYPYRGGLAAYSERLAYQFQKEGHEVELITFTLQYPNFLFPGKTQYSSDRHPDDLTINRLINSVNPFSWLKTGKYIKSKKPDIVVFCYWMAFMAPCFGTIARISKTKTTKFIGLIHNMIPHEPTLIDKLFPKYFVNSMDGFVAMANSVIADINIFDKKSKPKLMSPHPVYDHYGDIVDRSIAISKLKLDENYRYILFFGFIRHYKGLDLLIQAFADKRLREFPVKLLIAGEYYENSEPYVKLIKDNQLEDFVDLHTEFIEEDDVKHYFCAADIIAQPYRSATQSGVSQIAYHFNKPMLVTNVGGLADVVPDRKVGYVVDVNVECIADALVDFFKNNRADEFINNVLEEKKKFDWGEMTQTIIMS
ncbi:MAG: glycosyl transferase family 1 [Bacteroidales bacterium 36-12]|nr:MAG: glycosyl transferase family 1 [Bacteroidales bacterium 36-12]